MSALSILRRVTKPMTDAESVAMVETRYGAAGRENITTDDPVSARRAARVKADAKQRGHAEPKPKRIGPRR